MIPKKNPLCLGRWKRKTQRYSKVFTNLEKKHLSDYEIIEWNEDNFDINQNRYLKQAYEAKKNGLL